MTSNQNIFVWSTNDDLDELRDACLQVTWEALHVGRGVVSPLARVNLQEEIQRADILVCLCRPPAASVEQECALAIAERKAIFLFVFGETSPADLIEFRILLANAPKGSGVWYLTNPDAYVFAKEYLIALHRSSQTTQLRAGDLETRMQNIRRILLDFMERWPVVGNRYRKHEHLKRAIAKFYLDLNLSLIVNGPVSRVFFESGSSVAVLSEVFIDRLKEEWLRMSANLEIETNNVLSHFYFVLSQPFRVTLYPAGPPDTNYGGTYGPLERVDVPPQNTDAHPLTGLARHMTDRIRDHFTEHYAESGLIFGATSGIDLTAGSVGFGSHTGSFKNMLIKRALLESDCPVVLFLDQHKIPRPFLPDRCFPVCGGDLNCPGHDKLTFSWDYVCRSRPLSIACGFEDEDKARPVLDQLRSMGFRNVQEERRGESPWCFIASNDCFEERRQRWIKEARAGGNAFTGVRD